MSSDTHMAIIVEANVANATQGFAQLGQAAKQTDVNFKQLAVGISGVATAGFSLYQGYVNIQRSQITLDRQNLMLDRSTQTLKTTQEAYNAAIQKYGLTSPEATDAANKLSIAQDAVTVAAERASMAQTQVNNSMMTLALSVVPTVVTAVSSVASAAKAFGGVLEWLQMHPIMLAITGIVALAAALVVAYEKVEWFRNDVNAVGKAIQDFFIPPVKEVTVQLKMLTGTQYEFADSVRAAEHAIKSNSDLQKKIGDNYAYAAERTKQMSDATTQLTQDYDVMRAASDKNLGAIKKAFDVAFNKGDINAAIQNIQILADRYGISLGEAEKVVKSFAEAQGEIPQSIEEQLVGRAQADLERFKNCASAKAKDTATEIGTIIGETIRSGAATAEQLAMIPGLMAEWQKLYLLSGGQAPVSAGVTGPPTAMLKAQRLAENAQGFQQGGIVSSPTLAMVGEAGPEAIIPLYQTGFGNTYRPEIHVHIEGPVVQVQGDASRATAAEAASIVIETLKKYNA